ncbi:TonB-dependent receptor domain-containing protein [Kangiella shandongensis]|uniref:TonB-dependent receptor domain-containing protein n=1 Tax=Kangiella shandongensis TaxID=2763258 RepID=UPI001CBFBA65|nr:TonB-dependent receptor [Kangiella shandongensis]
MGSEIRHGLKIKPLCKAVSCALAFSTLSFQAYAAEQETEEEQAEPEKIIITGSRIRADEANDTVPIEVIMAEEAVDRGLTSVGQLLQESTLASGSPQVTAATSTAFVQNGGTGAETLSLRGLGAQRTLVLLNGRRAGPAGTRGSVSAFDFNTIPLSAVHRIEILKDGASSLYGSDAVAGVVNIITKTEDGGSFDFFLSQPDEEGGERARFSGTWGTSGQSGNFRLTLDYDKKQELAQGQRDYYACGERYYFDASSGERADIVDPRTGQFHCNDLAWGHVWLYDYAEAFFGSTNVTGNLAQFEYDDNLGQYIDPPAAPSHPGDIMMPPGWFLVDGQSPVLNADHPFQDLTTLSPESSRATVMATGEYYFSDTTTGYAEALFNRRETRTNGYRQFWGYIYNENFDFVRGFAGGNPQSQGWTGTQWLSPTAITDHSFSDITVDYTRFVVGLNGELGSWYWDMSLQSSRSDGDYSNAIIYNDSIRDQNWLWGSCEGTTTSVRGVPCQDIPWLDPQFLAGNISSDMKAFLFGVDTGNTLYEQDTFEATITGDLFEMPSGTSSAAFGIQYQHDQIEDTPGEQTLLGNGWGTSAAGITEGATETYAVFGEVQLPLLSDLPAVEELNLTASARYTEVPDAGSDTTYKLGLAWHIGGGVSIRGSHGTSFRAPALYELFLADETSFVGNRSIDPCVRWGDELAAGNISQQLADNCAADGIPSDYAGGAISATVFTGGGFGVLESETSESNTWGIVWRPEFADLSVSLDYFDFLIEGEVTQLGAANIVFQCYNSNFFETDPLCNQFNRDPIDNRIDVVHDSFINIAEQENSGFDLNIQYRTELPFGDLTLKTQHTYQKESKRGLFTDTVEDFNGTIGDPKHTGNGLIRFSRNNWYLSWFTNFIGKSDNYEFNDQFITFAPAGPGEDNVRRVGDVGGTSYHSLSFGYDFEESGPELVLGVRNLTDKAPPRISRGMGTRMGNSAFYSQYDPIGRSYFLNLKFDF